METSVKKKVLAQVKKKINFENTSFTLLIFVSNGKQDYFLETTTSWLSFLILLQRKLLFLILKKREFKNKPFTLSNLSYEF